VSPNVEEIAESISEPWKPVVVAEANGFQMKVAKLHGEFPWHVHEAEDELFYCTEGSFRIELENSDPQMLRAGERRGDRRNDRRALAAGGGRRRERVPDEGRSAAR